MFCFLSGKATKDVIDNRSIVTETIIHELSFSLINQHQNKLYNLSILIKPYQILFSTLNMINIAAQVKTTLNKIVCTITCRLIVLI